MTRDKFDVFLATPFEVNVECDGSRFPFYEKIEKALRKKGKRTFLSHRELKGLEYPVYTCQIAIPRTDLVIADIGIPSGAIGCMTQIAYENQIPIITFSREGEYTAEYRFLEGFLIKTKAQRIVFGNEEEGLEKITNAVKEFYRIKSR